MSDDRESNERDYEISRQLRSLNRRVERLEDTQVTGRELNRGFDFTKKSIFFSQTLSNSAMRLTKN